MDAKDLMLGDWVNFPIDIIGGETEYDSQTTEYQPMRIISISAWNNNDGEVESAEGVISDIEQLDPIPITKEILEKNFERDEERFINCNEFRDIEITEYNDGMWQVVIDEIEMSDLPTWKMYVCDVHQLQHALKLFGITKDITL